MNDDASEKLWAEWRPTGDVDGLTMSVHVAGRTGLRDLASRFDPETSFMVTTDGDMMVVTTAASIQEWPEAAMLPAPTGEWRHGPVDAGDGAQAVDMLEAFLAWTKSRGLVDEAASRRISRSVQMELASAARDTPR